MFTMLMEHLRSEYVPTIQLLWPALLAGVAVALAASVLGVFVVLRREALLALSLPQVVTLGTAVALRMEWPTLPAASGAVGLSLFLLAWVRRRESRALVLPALYVGGMSLAILLIANAGAHLIEVQNRFTGFDIAVEDAQAKCVAIVLAAVAVLVGSLWRRWLLLAQAPATAEVARLRPFMWNALFLGMLALVLVLSTDTLGPVMVVAMLFLPPACVLPWSARIPVAMLGSIVVAMILLAAGFALSIEMAWPLSQSVGGCGFALFLLSHAGAQLRG